MPENEKDRLAAEVEERWLDFQEGLSNKRKYPIQQFRAFWQVGVRYSELVKHDRLLHRTVVRAVNGLLDFLSVERKGFPARF